MKKHNQVVSHIAQVPALSPMFTKDLYLCQTTHYKKHRAKQHVLNKYLILDNLHTKINEGIWVRIQIKLSLQILTPIFKIIFF